MCCRFALLNKDARDLLARAGVPDDEGDTAYPENNYNIPPGVRIPAVRKSRTRARLECVPLHWGFVPPGAPARAPASQPLVNARAESLFEKPAFRDAARARRCLVPASAFYEWERSGNARLPWLFRLRDERPFFLAAIWNPAPRATAADKDACETCAIITVAPNALMQPIHHRMPAIVTAENAPAWLGGTATAQTELQQLLAPFPAEMMTAFRVSTRVNSVRNNDSACLAPDAPAPAPGQGMFLF